MSIKMRLDTDGLRALIKDNPEIELEIGKEVLNNISTDQIKSKVEARITEVLKSLVTNKGSWHAPTYEIKDAALRAAVNAAVSTAVTAKVDQAIQDKVQSLVSSALRIERDALTKDAKRLLLEMVTPEIAREVLLMTLNK
jgi:uncharacterized membrane protein YheB (UPF0754 family)